MNETPIKVSWEGPQRCEHCGIRDLVLFSALKNEDFAIIHEQIDAHRYEKGEFLYREGEPANHVFTVREGVVKLVHYSENGDESIVRLLKRGDVTGLESLTGQTYQQTAIVIDNVLTCRITKTVINKLSQKLPHFKQELFKRWQNSVDEARAWLTELRTGSKTSRIAQLLLRLAQDEPAAFIFIPSLNDIGAIVATKPTSASLTMAEFKRLRLISRVTAHRFKVDIDGIRSLIN